MIELVSESSFWNRTKLSVLPSCRLMFLYACSAIFRNSFSISTHVQLSVTTSCWSVNLRQFKSFSGRNWLGKNSEREQKVVNYLSFIKTYSICYHNVKTNVRICICYLIYWSLPLRCLLKLSLSQSVSHSQLQQSEAFRLRPWPLIWDRSWRTSREVCSSWSSSLTSLLCLQGLRDLSDE